MFSCFTKSHAFAGEHDAPPAAASGGAFCDGTAAADGSSSISSSRSTVVESSTISSSNQVRKWRAACTTRKRGARAVRVVGVSGEWTATVFLYLKMSKFVGFRLRGAITVNTHWCTRAGAYRISFSIRDSSI